MPKNPTNTLKNLIKIINPLLMFFLGVYINELNHKTKLKEIEQIKLETLEDAKNCDEMLRQFGWKG